MLKDRNGTVWDVEGKPALAEFLLGRGAVDVPARKPRKPAAVVSTPTITSDELDVIKDILDADTDEVTS